MMLVWIDALVQSIHVQINMPSSVSLELQRGARACDVPLVVDF